MAWQDNFNELYKTEFPLQNSKYFKFAIEEHKKKGTLQMNIRIFQHAKTEGGYEGPTKNGVTLAVTNKEDLEKLQKAFNDYFDKVKEYM